MHDHSYPVTSCHLLTANEAARIADVNRRMSLLPELAQPMPQPPVTADGQPDHARAGLQAFAAQYEAAAALNERAAGAKQALADASALVYRAAAADPGGRGGMLTSTLAITLRCLPGPADLDNSKPPKPLYPTIADWLAVFTPAVDQAVSSLTATAREGYRGE